jgi:hypothetical protein
MPWKGEALECGSLLPLSPARACSRPFVPVPNPGQQAGLSQSGSKLPHSKAPEVWITSRYPIHAS